MKKLVQIHPMLSQVKVLLKARPESMTYEQIEADTGITVAWLTRFASSDGTDSSFSRISNLYEYLSGNKIELV